KPHRHILPWMHRAYFAALSAPLLLLPACGGTETATTSTGGSGTEAGGGGAGGSGTGGGGEGGSAFTCTAPYVTKGPWSLAIDETHAKIRWEACASDSKPDVHYTKEGGGSQETATSTATPITLTETHTAPLNTMAPPDAAGTYYTHEAALEGLEEG